jgi:hypothetical protein
VFLSPLGKKSFQLSTKSTISTWSAELTRSSKMATSFSPRDSSWLSSPLPTIAVSSTTPALWWASTILWCAVSKFLSQLKRSKRSPMERVQVETDPLHLLEPNIESHASH